jgi:hypothetical protein
MEQNFKRFLCTVSIKEPLNIFTSAERAINSLLEFASLMKEYNILYMLLMVQREPTLML